MAWGFEDGDFADDGDEDEGAPALWPENGPVVELFDALATQWHDNGLRYEALPVVFDLLGTAKRARRALWDGLRVMEHEARRAIRERNAGRK